MRRAGLLALALLSAGPSRPAEQPGSVVTSLTLFVGNVQGLWRSTDWGGSWQPLDRAGLGGLGATRTIVPVGPRVWAGGAGELFVSDDFGATWKRQSTLTEVHSLLTSRYPEADPTVFAGTALGLLKSTDGGLTFQASPVTGVVRHLLWPGPALVLAGEDGLRVSDNGLADLRPASVGLPDGAILSVAVSSFFAADPVVFAGPQAKGLYRSTDGGRSFAPAGLEGRTVRDLAWLGPLLYAATDGGLYRSDDGARRFERIGQGLEGRELRRLFFPHAPGSGAELFLATDDGVFRSADGGLRFERSGLRGQPVDVLATFPPPDPVVTRRRR